MRLSKHRTKKTSKQPFEALIGILDVFACHSYMLLSSHEWLQLWQTNKTFSNNGHIRLALYVTLWRKMNKTQETPVSWNQLCYCPLLNDIANYYGEIFPAMPSWGFKHCRSVTDYSISPRYSPFGRFIVAIKQPPVVSFEPSQHAENMPHVYTRGEVVNKVLTYQHVGRVVYAKGKCVNVKTIGGETQLYMCDELYCRRRYYISDTEDVPQTLREDDDVLPVDYYFLKHCPECHLSLVVKRSSKLFNTFDSMCREVPNLMASIAHEDREHRITCFSRHIFQPLEREIFS